MRGRRPTCRRFLRASRQLVFSGQMRLVTATKVVVDGIDAARIPGPVPVVPLRLVTRGRTGPQLPAGKAAGNVGVADAGPDEAIPAALPHAHARWHGDLGHGRRGEDELPDDDRQRERRALVGAPRVEVAGGHQLGVRHRTILMAPADSSDHSAVGARDPATRALLNRCPRQRAQSRQGTSPGVVDIAQLVTKCWKSRSADDLLRAARAVADWRRGPASGPSPTHRKPLTDHLVCRTGTSARWPSRWQLRFT